MVFSDVLKDCGSIDIKPYAVLEEKEIHPEYSIQSHENGTIFYAEEKGVFSDKLTFTFSGGDILCRRVFENMSPEKLCVKELAAEISGITFGENPRDDYFYHNENPRIYEAMTFPIDFDRTMVGVKQSEFDIQAGNRWADPGVICERIGASPYQPFPAVLVSNYNTKNGIVHGTLSQKVFFHNYLISHDKNGKINVTVFSSFKATEHIYLPSGGVLCDEWYMGKTENADDIEKIFEKYAARLRERLNVSRAKSNVSRTSVVWGSWNDGIFRDVNETLMLEEAEYLSKNFPTVKWIQLDDGYSRYACDNNVSSGIATPFDNGIDERRFPNGLSHLTDGIRKFGLRPAIWIGGLCPKGTEIYKQHPEWFIDYGYRLSSLAPLDVSRSDVRDYMAQAISALTSKCGFEGVKLDFWSYAFEDSHDLYSEKNASGYEYRRQFLSTIRDSIPEDGYLQTACDIGLGNPFLGEFVNNYRYGIDIAEGNWDHVKTNYLWGAACLATHTGDLAVPNSDSVGLFPGLGETEAMFCINYCLVTHTLVEIAGRLSKSDNAERIKILKKAVCNPNNGQDVYFADYDYRLPKYGVPEIMYFKTPHFSVRGEDKRLPLRTVGVFNILEEEKTFTLTPEKMGLENGKYIFVDVWSGQKTEADGKFTVTVEPHGSRLFAVCAENCIIYDADFRINSVYEKDGMLCIESDYAYDEACVTFSGKVKSMHFDGKPISFRCEDEKICFRIPEKGTISVNF